MLEAGLQAVAHCINPDCHRPLVRSLSDEICPTCKTPLHLHDRYIPLQQLASNRHTATYRVYDQRAKAEVVMKVLLDPTPAAREFFHRTSKVLSSMRCGGLPRVTVKSHFEVPLRGSVHTLSCFVMERVRGRSLLAVIAECPSGCPEAWVMTWLKQLLEAVQFLHGRQLVHGNLTPENILLRDDQDQVVVIGFGNPKALGGGSLAAGEGRSQVPANGYKPLPSMAGMAPTAADDLFAIGRIGIHLLTGLHPLDLEDERTGTLRWQQRAQVNARLAELLDKLTDPRPEGRYQTAAAAKAALVPLMTPKDKRRWFSWRRSPAAKPQQRRRSPTPAPQLMMQDVRPRSLEFPAIADQVLLLLQTLLNLAIVIGLTAAIGFWLLFCSPLATALQQGLMSLSQPLPVALSPTLALFGLVGMITAGALLNLANDRLPWFWLATALGASGYGVGWFVWQGSPATLPAIALARMATVAALGVTVILCKRRDWLTQLVVTSLGTAVTMATVARSRLFNQDFLTLLFAPDQMMVLPFDSGLLLSVALFFASLGATIGLWFRLSEQVAIPIMRAMWGQRR